ncbi:MFS domain-containing protein [Fusarium keratoplasticum]|uniref:MFS domain-containing protein n=1 Tax=Fusarium keratoplasticum TaxID=1328300 RepID=A0ACC0R779_9HYPO|nr:MFS domain-containing protein [Fusarium keratoplasticum]KAI8675958.1 MFS domain-containing protein [Fusarium keratoplasticum]
MALLSLGPVVSHALILVVAMSNICILSYDAGMINNLNAVQPYFEHFNLDSDLIGLNVAIISAGCIFGSPVVGPIVDRWGRKTGLGMGSVCIILGVVLQASAGKVAQLIAGRFIIGFATIINGSIAPMWVMELASPKYRSMLSSSVLVSVPFTSFLVTCIILGIYDKQSDWAWRGIMLGEAVPSILSLCLLPFVEESPRWLFYKGRGEEATNILARLHADGDIEHPMVVAESQEILGALEHEKENNGGWKDLVSPAPNLKRFSIAVLMNIFYQILGGNMILYFSSFLIAKLGIESRRTVILINIGLLLWKAFCSVGGVFLIDRIGARKPLIAGTSATVALFGMLSGLSYLSDERPNETGYAIGAVVVVGLFLLAVSTSWMILAYTYPPEVLRYSQRAKGVVVAQAIGYAFSFLNLYTAPLALEKIGWKYYAINGSWNFGILIVVYWLFVETKGRTLEEIDELFDGMVYTGGVIIGHRAARALEEEETGDAGSIAKRQLTATSANKE